METLPGVLQQIAEATSYEVAALLAREVGGTEISVPRNPKPDSPLARIVGIDAAKAIADQLGWGRLLIPQGDFRGAGGQRALVRQMIQQGASINEAARAANCHERTVRRLKQALREEQKQHKLPGM